MQKYPRFSISAMLSRSLCLLAIIFLLPLGLRGQATMPTSFTGGDFITPYIQRLADTLKTKERIYEWVKNNIEFTPYNGLAKGAHLTAVELSGNDFDTCALLVALLKAANNNAQVGYRYGLVKLETDRSDGNDGAHWLSVDKSQVGLVLYNAKMKYENSQAFSLGQIIEVPGNDGNTRQVGFFHIWVELREGASTYILDPSFKSHYYTRPPCAAPPTGSLAGFANETNYVSGSTSLLSIAAGTETPVGASSGSFQAATGANGCKNLVYARLNSLAGTFFTDMGTAMQGSTPYPAKNYGVSEIKPELVQELPQSLPAAFEFETDHPSTYSDQIPSAYYTVLRLTLGTLAKPVYLATANLRGRKLAVWFSGKLAQLYLDDDIVLYSDDNSRVEEASASNQTTMAYSVQYYYAYRPSDSPSYTANPLPRAQGGCVVINYAFGKCLGRLQQRLGVLAGYSADGVAASDRRNRTEILYITGLQYSSQDYELGRMFGAACDSYVSPMLDIGLFSFRDRPTVSIALYAGVYWPRRMLVDGDFDANKASSTEWSYLLRIANAYLASALEHITLEQTTGTVSASMSKLLQRSVELGGAVYYIKSGADYSQSLFKNYAANALETFSAYMGVNTPRRLLAPSSGNLACGSGSYRGAGFMIETPVGGGAMSMVTSLNELVKGGAMTDPNSLAVDIALVPNFLTDPISVTEITDSLTRMFFGEPIDLSNGAFYSSKTDLSLGDEGVSGLTLSRRYTSQSAASDPVGLGRGWTHSYDIKLYTRHANTMELERANLGELAPVFVAAQAMFQLTRLSPATAKSRVIPALAACWLGEQLQNSRVSISTGDRFMEFTKLPDGSFAPPDGIAATLVKAANGTYSLTFYKGLEIAFDAAGKFTSIIDRRNPTSIPFSITATYSKAGRLTRVTDAFKRFINFDYTGAKLTSVTDSTGRSVYYRNTASTSGNVLEVEDTVGDTLTYLSNLKGQITEIHDGYGRTTVRSVYDEFGKISEQYAFGRDDRRWTYGFIPGFSRETDPSLNSSLVYLDKRGRVIRQINGEGDISATEYDAQDRVVRALRYLDHSHLEDSTKVRVEEYAYNNYHELTSVKNSAGNTRTITPSNATSTSSREEKNFEGITATSTTYNSYHKPSAVTLPGGVVTTYEYEARGRLYRIRPPAVESGNWITYTYDPAAVTVAASAPVQRVTAAYPDGSSELTNFDVLGNIIQTIDRRGKKTTFEYDANRRPTMIAQWTGTFTASSPVGGVPTAGSLIRSFAYDANGNKSSETVGGKTFRYVYDEHGKILKTIAPDGVTVQENKYNESNLLREVVDGNGLSAFSYYDRAHRQSGAANELLETSAIHYDQLGRVIETDTPLGNKTTFGYDTAGYLHEQFDGENQAAPPAVNKSVVYGYDKDGRTKTVQNRRGYVYRTDYYDTDRKVESKTPLNTASSRPTKAESSTRGLLLKTTLPTGKYFEDTAFDTEGRPTTRVLHKSDNAIESTLNFGYYPGGLLNTVSETPLGGSAKTITRIYDDLGRIRSYQDGAGNYVRYAYDADGNLQSIQYPDGFTVGYVYDRANRLSLVMDWPSLPATVSDTPDPAPTRITRYNYDQGGRVSSIVRPNGVVTSLAYDGANRLVGITERNAGATPLSYLKYGYDADGLLKTRYRLPPSTTALPLFSSSASYNDDNRLSTWAQTTVTHDYDGNMTFGPFFSTSGFAPYTYDVRNRLVSVGNSTTGVTSFTYDAEGNRIGQAYSGANVSYIIDPHGAALPRVLTRAKTDTTITPNVTTTTRYVYGQGLLYEVDGGTGAATYYHYDNLGSTIALTSGSGTVVERFEYNPYGRVVQRNSVVSDQFDTPFLYVGQAGVQTDGTKLLYMRARYYSPEVMRFVNADPIGFSGGMNWYAYANGNPHSYGDPSGLSALSGFCLGSESLWISPDAVMTAVSIPGRILEAIGISQDEQLMLSVLTMQPEIIMYGSMTRVGLLVPSTELGSNGLRVNVFGEGEAPGFVDVSTSERYATGTNGVTRPVTTSLADGSASDIFIRYSPLDKETLGEITRLSGSGTRITLMQSLDEAGTFHSQRLLDAFGDRAAITLERIFTSQFQTPGDATGILKITIK